jgi:predicted molibdopterin-dependent oxidoreductase YjgC
MAAHWHELIAYAAERLREVIEKHGRESVAVLGSPFNTNEENFLAAKLARDVIGTPYTGWSGGAPDQAAARAIAEAFGTDALPSDMISLARSDVVFLIADDLESSHNIAALRIKDGIAGNPVAPRDGTLVLISHLWGEMADFAEPYGGAWLRPRPGDEPAVVDALARIAAGQGAAEPSIAGGDLDVARAALEMAKDPSKTVSVVFATPRFDAGAAERGARAAANLAIALRGEKAAESLYILPTEANVNGMRDMGVGVESSFDDVFAGALEGDVKAIISVGDNPLMFAPGRGRVERALDALELLVVIDSQLTGTAKRAHVVLADVPAYGKTGTYTNAERRVNRVHAAMEALGDARPASLALVDLANELSPATPWAYAHPDEITNEIAATIEGYERFVASYGLWGKARAARPATSATRQDIGPGAAAGAGEMVLTTGRTLYTSFEGASVRATDADKLHREEFVEMHPSDAADLRVSDEDEVTLLTEAGTLDVRCKISGRVLEGVLFLPAYHGGGAVTSLLGLDGAPPRATVRVKAPA